MTVASAPPTEAPDLATPARWLDDLLEGLVPLHADALHAAAADLGRRLWARDADRLHGALRQFAHGITQAPVAQALATQGQHVRVAALALTEWLQAHAGPAERALVDIGMEHERLHALVLHGDHLLDLLEQAGGSAPGQQARLRALQAAARAGHESHGLGLRLLAHRRELAQLLLDDMERLRGQLLAAADAPGRGQAERDLRHVLARGLAGCLHLRDCERGLQRSVATLCEQLRAAR